MRTHSLVLVMGLVLIGGAAFAQTPDPFAGGPISVRGSSPVPQTGQTLCYGIGDDGDCQAGVSCDPRFTDIGDGTVRDNLTGLIWLQDANCFGIRLWATALADANTLADGFCGLTDGSVAGDWRLPNVREMHSLVDYGNSFPALHTSHPFIGVESSPYWTSSSNTGVSLIAWYVNFNYGHVAGWPKNFSHYVWPVRNPQ